MFHTTAYNFSEIKWLNPGDVYVYGWKLHQSTFIFFTNNVFENRYDDTEIYIFVNPA